MQLLPHDQLIVSQVHELTELIGFETRNKYQILNSQNMVIGYAAEQQKGFFNFIFRQFLGHWRSFEVHFFDQQKQLFLIGHHPFRWYFERIEVKNTQNQVIGALQKRFSILSKKFDVEDENGKVLMTVSSPIWKIWTFQFQSRNRNVASISKKWSGFLSEAFTDKDRFLIEYKDRDLTENSKRTLLVAAVFIDLLFFEHKAG